MVNGIIFDTRSLPGLTFAPGVLPAATYDARPLPVLTFGAALAGIAIPIFPAVLDDGFIAMNGDFVTMNGDNIRW